MRIEIGNGQYTFLQTTSIPTEEEVLSGRRVANTDTMDPPINPVEDLYTKVHVPTDQWICKNGRAFTDPLMGTLQLFRNAIVGYMLSMEIFLSNFLFSIF